MKHHAKHSQTSSDDYFLMVCRERSTDDIEAEALLFELEKERSPSLKVHINERQDPDSLTPVLYAGRDSFTGLRAIKNFLAEERLLIS